MMVYGYLISLFCTLLVLLSSGEGFTSTYSTLKPLVLHLDLPASDDGRGGLISVDVNDDGRRDWLITKPGHIVAYDVSGAKLWGLATPIQVTQKSETNGLPGWHGPGVQAADIDGDGATEVLYLTQDGQLHIVAGGSGQEKWQIHPPVPAGAERWEHLVIANLRGQGDHDFLLQATNAQGYRMGRYLAAYAWDEGQPSNIKRLWKREDFLANAHTGARIADLDGDGRDEVLGGMILAPDGTLLFRIPLQGHIDSIFVADVRADSPGLEVVALEEGGEIRPFDPTNFFFRTINRLVNRIFPSGNRVFLYNKKRLLWQTHHRHQEPQNAVIGNFDPKRPGLEVWCRSRYNTHQKPFVFDANGGLIANYQMDHVAPAGWTIKGVEVIFTIDWMGGAQQFAAAKERHKSGDVGIFDPLQGMFLHRFKEQADRLYVADVAGDWREELIVLNGNKLHIYQNDQPNPNPKRPSLWTNTSYRRSKMTWNYYSP